MPSRAFTRLPRVILARLRRRVGIARKRLGEIPGKALAVIGLPVIAFAATFFIIGTGHASQGFYETAAQIIPVLLLAFLIEGRAFRIAPTMDTSTRFLVILTLVLLVAGEGVSLYDLAGGDETSRDLAIVAASIAGGFVGIGVIALWGEPSEDDWRRFRSDYRRAPPRDEVPERQAE